MRHVLTDVVVIVVLGGLAWLVCAGLVPLTTLGDIPIFDDHPGKYFLFHRTLEQTRDGHSFLAWNRGWYGGYPDNLFYPPGFIMAGWLLDHLTLRSLPIVMLYNVMLLITLVSLPVVMFCAIRLAGGGRTIAFVAALGATTITGGFSDVREGVITGLVNSRLSLSLLPLVAVMAGEQTYPRYRHLTVSLITAVMVLLHPVHGFLAGLLVAGSTVVRFRKSVPTLLYRLIQFSIIVAAINAFWLWATFSFPECTVPLRIFPVSMTYMLKGYGREWHLTSLILIAIGLAFAIGFRADKDSFVRSRGLVAFLLVWPLVEIFLLTLSMSQIDVHRLHDGVYLLALCTIALAWHDFRRLNDTGNAARQARTIAVTALCVVSLLNPLNIPRYLEQRRETATIDSFYFNKLPQKDRIEQLWGELARTPGRKLFLFGEARFGSGTRSHLMAMSPLFSPLDIVGGTYTHNSPIAARMIEGFTTSNASISKLIERSLDRRFFGMEWKAFDRNFFLTVLDSYDIDRIIAFKDATHQITSLATIDWPSYSSGIFIIFCRTTEYGLSTGCVRHGEGNTIAMSGCSGRLLSVPAMPWASCFVDGQKVTTRKSVYGLVTLERTVTPNEEIVVDYTIPAIFHILFIISVFSILFIAMVAGLDWRREARRSVR